MDYNTELKTDNRQPPSAINQEHHSPCELTENSSNVLQLDSSPEVGNHLAWSHEQEDQQRRRIKQTAVRDASLFIILFRHLCTFSFALQIGIDEQDFNAIGERHLQYIWRAAKNHFDLFRCLPSKSVLQTNVLTSIGAETKNLCTAASEFIEKLFDDKSDILLQEVLDEIAETWLRAFVMERKAMAKIEDLVLQVRHCSVLPEEILAKLNAAVEVANQISMIGQAPVDEEGPFHWDVFRSQKSDRIELVAGVLVEGQLGILGGPTKSMKTLIGLDLAFAIATGSKFLGHWKTNCVRVVGFYSGESGQPTLVHKGRLISEALLRQPQNSTRMDRQGFRQMLNQKLVIKTSLPDLGSGQELSRLRAEIKHFGFQVLLLDPVLLCLGSAADKLANPAATGELIRRIRDICDAEGCTLVLLHHTAGDRVRQQGGKSREPLGLTDLAYPGITNFVRQWICVNRREDYDDIERRNKLWLTIGGSGMQAGGTFGVDIIEGRDHDRWEVSVQPRGEIIQVHQADRQHRQQQADRDARDRIVTVIGRHPCGETVQGLWGYYDGGTRYLGGLSKPTIEGHLAQLERERVVERTRIRKGNRDHEAWRLSAPPPACTPEEQRNV